MGVHLADDARHHARRHQLRRVHTHAAVGGELPIGAPTLLLLLLLLLLPLLLPHLPRLILLKHLPLLPLPPLPPLLPPLLTPMLLLPMLLRYTCRTGRSSTLSRRTAAATQTCFTGAANSI